MKLIKKCGPTKNPVLFASSFMAGCDKCNKLDLLCFYV